MTRLRDYLELVRPANVVTALGDILAGYAVAGLAAPRSLPWLLGASVCLYAGGIVLNDVFDLAVDRVERPERPLPSGRVPVRTAAVLGGGLLVAGVGAAFAANPWAAAVAAATAGVVLLYDAWGKRQALAGPVNMGLCRAGNLALGIAAVPEALTASWPILALPLVYITAVTAVSRGEVHGGKRPVAAFALISLGLLLLALVWLSGWSGPPALAGLALTAVLAWRVVPPFWRVWRQPDPAAVRRAVRTGVPSLVLLDAVIGAVYAGPLYSIAILAIALSAGWLARRFAVT
jgi:4-hydroxybenzoate polyprenyltransferase